LSYLANTQTDRQTLAKNITSLAEVITLILLIPTMHQTSSHSRLYFKLFLVLTPGVFTIEGIKK